MNILPIWRTAIVMMSLTCGLATAATATARPSRSYTVQSGDTLSKIARKHGVSLSSVLAANRGINPSALNRGQRVVIPGSGTTAAAPASTAATPKPAPKPESRPSARVPAAKPDPFAAAGLAAGGTNSSGGSAHTVRSGETLSSIARTRKVSVANLRAWNKLSSDGLRVGQKLNLSGQSAATPAPAPERRPVGDVDEIERNTPPPPAPPAAPQATSTGRIAHIVQKGETFSTIARKHGISWGKLYRANAGVDPESLRPGQRIWVPSSEMVNTTPPPPADETTRPAADSEGEPDPAPRQFVVNDSRPRLVYRVLRGDSVATISRKFKISEADFRRYNRLNGDTLATGDTVYVPAYPGSSPSAMVSTDRGVNATY